MVRAKKYETMSKLNDDDDDKFVKVMPRILRLFFSGHDVHGHVGEHRTP